MERNFSESQILNFTINKPSVVEGKKTFLECNLSIKKRDCLSRFIIGQILLNIIVCERVCYPIERYKRFYVFNNCMRRA